MSPPPESIGTDCPKPTSGGIWNEVLAKLCDAIPVTASGLQSGQDIVKAEALDDEDDWTCKPGTSCVSPPVYDNLSDDEAAACCK